MNLKPRVESYFIAAFSKPVLPTSEIFLSRKGIALSDLIKQNINALFNFHIHSHFVCDVTNIDMRDEKFNFTCYFILMLQFNMLWTASPATFSAVVLFLFPFGSLPYNLVAYSIFPLNTAFSKILSFHAAQFL